MKKLFKLMTITTFATITSLQTVACNADNAMYNQFLSYVNETKTNHSAFFGFLGSLNDNDPKGGGSSTFYLQTAIDAFLQKDSITQKSPFDDWYSANETTFKEKLNCNGFSIHTFLEPQPADVSSNPVSDFWNNKKIQWQRNIFHWIYNQKDSYKNPLANKVGVTNLDAKVDPNDKNKGYMFTALPILFIIFNGKVIMAGQNWTVGVQYPALGTFIKDNLISQ